MYLKNISLRGFKSFKNKSQLFFEPGVSVVVGPNGSGKSNIADAISWVLGEQSPKSLRGNSMGDVIFKSKNEEMGIAEVSLMFDNSDRLFNTEFRDVKFTRRVFSKGGSDYFINSSPCRLIDIQEMTADSGIGKGLHIIINQGQINDIAMLKSLERKIIIDEVLGISKHKNRRDKSIGKLQKVKNDIERIDDLTEEIKRTMDPLEIEANRAREYAEVSNHLKKEEISLFIAYLNNSNKEWESENITYAKSKDKLEDIEAEALRLEKEKNSLLKLMDKKNSEYELWKSRIDMFNSKSDQLGHMISLAESKRNVFATLYNMFELELGSIESAGSLRSPLKQYDNKIKQSFLENILNKLNKLDKLFLKFLEKLKGKIKDDVDGSFIENEGKIIEEELKGLFKMIERQQNEKKNGQEDGPHENKSNGEGTGNLRQRLDKVEAIKEVCSINLKRSKKIYLLLNDYKSIWRDIKDKLYPEFEKRRILLSGSQKKIGELDGKINQLNMSRLNLENKMYKINLKKEQVKEKVKIIAEGITDNYNMSMEYALKSYSPSTDIRKSEAVVRRLKNDIKKYGNVNPNAAIEYSRIKKRFDFLNHQRLDLSESKNNLEELIKDMNIKIADLFFERFDEINRCFRRYFKVLFPLGEGEMQLERNGGPDKDETGVDLKVDIGNNKFAPISLLSGGEKSLVSMAFLFSIYSINPSPFYVFDEVDAALDDVNIGRFLTLVKKFSEKQQIIIITHQKRTMEIADTIYGVTMQSSGISKIIAEKIEKHAEIN